MFFSVQLSVISRVAVSIAIGIIGIISVVIRTVSIVISIQVIFNILGTITYIIADFIHYALTVVGSICMIVIRLRIIFHT